MPKDTTTDGRTIQWGAHEPHLLDLQAQPHAPDCQSRRVGSTAHPWCSCGLNVTKRQAGLVTQRDGPSVRPNWPKRKGGGG